MFEASLDRLLSTVPDDAVVLDVGAWGRPLRRADWVLDHMPYETRGLYGFDGDPPERFDASRWIRRDICDRTPWPFDDDSIDFVVCSHTLEDVRDPVWVCQEISRVGKAGYIEVPSRLEEQAYGVQGPWVGWGHHHWLVDIEGQDLRFFFKHHIVHGKPAAHFPAGFADTLAPHERVQMLWWQGEIRAEERSFAEFEKTDDYLESFVADELARRGMTAAQPRASRRSRWHRG